MVVGTPRGHTSRHRILAVPNKLGDQKKSPEVSCSRMTAIRLPGCLIVLGGASLELCLPPAKVGVRRSPMPAEHPNYVGAISLPGS